MAPGVYDHQVFMLYGDVGKGVLHAFLIQNSDLIPDYEWAPNSSQELIVPLATTPPPNDAGDPEGWCTAIWCTEEQKDAFVNDIKPEMPPPIRDRTEITGHTVVGRPDFDAWLLTHGFYRKDSPDA